MEVIKFVAEHGLEIVAGVAGLSAALLVIALIIPGEQPDKFLQGVVDFLSKFSKKKPE